MELFKKVYYFVLDILQTLLLAAALFMVVYLLIMRPYEVKGNSMYPYLKDKEYVLTNLLTKRLFEFKRGDVIVFKAPTDPDKDFIKRVIGISGDTILLKDSKVYVNNVIVNESRYLDPSVQTNGGAFLKENEPIQVPTDNYFVLGDNRSESSDSREWGFVPKNNIIGKSFFVYWPLQDSMLIKNPYK